MRRNVNSMIFVLMLLVFLTGCSQKPQANNADDAITQSQTVGQEASQRVQYLIGQANAFIKSEKYDDAVNVANHILTQLDANSAEAKSILEKATAQLQAMAQQKVEEVKGQADEAMGDVKKSLGNFGQ